MCAEGKGICSPERPGGFIPWTGTGPEPPPAPEYIEYGACDTYYSLQTRQMEKVKSMFITTL